MNFKKVFKGYDPAEVDKYIAENAAHEKSIRVSQKERIDELSEENYTLRQQVKKYQENEQAISQSLIAAEQLAQQLKKEAEAYSDSVLSRAKTFYATWRAYSKTLISTLSAEEVREFNKLQKKLEKIINAYEGSDVVKEVEDELSRQQVAATIQTPVKKSRKTAATKGLDNPIDKVAVAADQAIDLKELAEPQQSLEGICAELGLLRRP